MRDLLLEIHDLHTHFFTEDGVVKAMPQCTTEEPLWKEVGGGHYTACHLY